MKKCASMTTLVVPKLVENKLAALPARPHHAERWCEALSKQTKKSKLDAKNKCQTSKNRQKFSAVFKVEIIC